MEEIFIPENYARASITGNRGLESLMTFLVPYGLDMQATDSNKKNWAYKWLRKLPTMVQHSDNISALLTPENEEGQRKHYNLTHEIPNTAAQDLRIKMKQFRLKQKILFAEFSTELTPTQLKNLPGIENINIPTHIFRSDNTWAN